MSQETTPIIRSYMPFLILFLYLVLGIAFLAVVKVHTTMPLPHEKTTVAFLIRVVVLGRPLA